MKSSFSWERLGECCLLVFHLDIKSILIASRHSENRSLVHSFVRIYRETRNHNLIDNVNKKLAQTNKKLNEVKRKCTETAKHCLQAQFENVSTQNFSIMRSRENFELDSFGRTFFTSLRSMKSHPFKQKHTTYQ